MKKQVEKAHYRFSKYVHKRRWASMWHQIDEVLAFDPARILEIGPGPGVFKATASLFGPRVETLDIDPELEPDHVASVFDMPFREGAYDVVCAFQMLEHIPYEDSLRAFREMTRVAERGIVISLPDARHMWPYALHVPARGRIWLHVPAPAPGRRTPGFDGEHYWEINKRGYALARVKRDLSMTEGIELVTTYRVDEFPYHRFLVFRKTPAE